MGTIIILIFGAVGAISACRKSLLQSWMLLMNVLISFYLGSLLSFRVATEVLTFGNLPIPIRNAICVIGIFLIVLFFVSKVEEQIIPDNAIELPVAPAISKIFQGVFGFAASALIAALVLWGAYVVPAIQTWPPSLEIRQQSCKTLCAGFDAVNVLLFHRATPDELKTLTDVGVIYTAPAEKKADDEKTAPVKKVKKKKKRSKKNVSSVKVQKETPKTVTPAEKKETEDKTQSAAPVEQPKKVVKKKHVKKAVQKLPETNKKEAASSSSEDVSDYVF